MATTIDLGKIRIQWKGDYNAAVTYELLDVTKYKGDSYIFISTIAAAAKTPDITSEWELMVSGGDQWSSGTAVPTGGNPGDMYIKTDDEKMYKNTAGTWAVIGDVGGSRWTSGTAVPTGGESGDFYLKTDDEKIYENVAGTWTVKLDIGGGVWTSSTSNGSGGESGDWHINTTTKDIQENVSGTWTTRVNLSVSGSNLSDLANVPALDSGKFLTNDGTNASWATVDVTGSAVGGDVTGTVGNIQIAANAVTDAELNSTKLNGIAASANNYSHPTGAGDKHLPTGGTSGQVMTNTASGTGTWQDAAGGTLCSFLLTDNSNNWYAHSGSLSMNHTGGAGHLTGFTTSGNAVVVPEAGKYAFICNIYTAWSDSNNGFKFLINGNNINGAAGGNLHYQDLGDNSNDRTITHSIVLSLNSGDAITIVTINTSDWYGGHSHWAGFKIN